MKNKKTRFWNGRYFTAFLTLGCLVWLAGVAVILATNNMEPVNAKTRQEATATEEPVVTVIPLTTEPIPTETPPPPYTEEELDEMSRILACECGSNWIPDWVQLYTGYVILNRMERNDFPDTIHDVLYQKGQYGPVISGWFETVKPDARTIENAKKVLTEGSQIPQNVIFQSNHEHGDGTYAKYEDPILGTTYFCYVDD